MILHLQLLQQHSSKLWKHIWCAQCQSTPWLAAPIETEWRLEISLQNRAKAGSKFTLSRFSTLFSAKKKKTETIKIHC